MRIEAPSVASGIVHFADILRGRTVMWCIDNSSELGSILKGHALTTPAYGGSGLKANQTGATGRRGILENALLGRENTIAGSEMYNSHGQLD